MSFVLTGKCANSGIYMNAREPVVTCKGDLRVEGTLHVTGNLSINGRTLTGEDVSAFLDQQSTELRLRQIYPTVQSAWEVFQLTLLMCASSLPDNDEI